MKKWIIAFLLMTLIMSCSVPALAEEKMESLYADEEIAAQIKETDDSIVIIIYHDGDYLWNFAYRKKVDDISSEEEIFYLVITPKEEYCAEEDCYKSILSKDYFQYKDGELKHWGIPAHDFFYSGFYEYAVSPDRVFDEGIEVYDAYCLSGSRYTDGIYIYYETSEGDYLLCKKQDNDEQMFLLTLEEFYDVADAYWAEVQAHKGEFVGGAGFGDVLDLTPYEFNKKDQAEIVESDKQENSQPETSETQENKQQEKKDYTIVVIAASALGVVALTAGAILVLRKKKR